MRDSLTNYFRATEFRRRCQAECEAASARLDLAYIRERAAEVESQHNPLASIDVTPDLTNREKMIQAVKYVMTGRKE